MSKTGNGFLRLCSFKAAKAQEVILAQKDTLRQIRACQPAGLDGRSEPARRAPHARHCAGGAKGPCHALFPAHGVPHGLVKILRKLDTLVQKDKVPAMGKTGGLVKGGNKGLLHRQDGGAQRFSLAHHRGSTLRCYDQAFCAGNGQCRPDCPGHGRPGIFRQHYDAAQGEKHVIGRKFRQHFRMPGKARQGKGYVRGKIHPLKQAVFIDAAAAFLRYANHVVRAGTLAQNQAASRAQSLQGFLDDIGTQQGRDRPCAEHLAVAVPEGPHKQGVQIGSTVCCGGRGIFCKGTSLYSHTQGADGLQYGLRRLVTAVVCHEQDQGIAEADCLPVLRGRNMDRLVNINGHDLLFTDDRGG